MESKFIVTAFVDAINTRDVQALTNLTAAPCLFHDPVYSATLTYRIYIEQIISDCNMVVLIGHAENEAGRIPAVWTAQLCGCRIVDWHAYYDGQLSCLN